MYLVLTSGVIELSSLCGQETSLGDKRVESHGDSDFEKTLEQLDSSRKKV